MLENLEIGMFAPHLGETFRVQAADASWAGMTLIEATALGQDPAPEGRRLPFSIVFRGSRDRVLPQRIYRVEHDAIGAFDLFLVPIGPDQEGMRYEAVFG